MTASGAHDGSPLARDVGRGRSILRAMGDRALAGWCGDLRGTVLDLACGRGSSLRSTGPDARWVGVDLVRRADVRADITAALPFRDGCADAAVLSWFLYIAPAPGDVLREIRRVLRGGGVLHLLVPLVFPVTPEPQDLWRFTGPGVERLLGEAGFSSWTVVPLGGRWTSAMYLLDPFLRPRRVVAPLAARACMRLDLATNRRGRLPPNPVGYAARAVT